MKEMVNNPTHYNDKSGVECIDIIVDMYFCTGNAIKYLYRAGAKDDTIQECKKAIWYLNKAKSRKEVNICPFYIKDMINKVAATRHVYVGDALQCIYYGDYDRAIESINLYIDYISSRSAE